MVTCTKDSGSKGRDTEKGPRFCKAESDTWACGKRIEDMVRELCGCKIRPNMLGFSCRTRSMGRGKSTSQTAK